MVEETSYLAKEITRKILQEARNYRLALQEYREFSEIDKINLRMTKLVNQLTNLFPDEKKKRK